MVDLSIVKRLPEGTPPFSYGFLMVFQFSYGFPMDFPIFPLDFPSFSTATPSVRCAGRGSGRVAQRVDGDAEEGGLPPDGDGAGAETWGYLGFKVRGEVCIMT